MCRGTLCNVLDASATSDKTCITNHIAYMARLFILLLTLAAAYSSAETFEHDFVNAALDRTRQSVAYDGSYFTIAYPNGDVPSHLGVCTDVIVRSYRAIGTDLQVLVHEDMSKYFSQYPSNRIWGLTAPDKNIDHRRVPNLQAFFSRHGESLSISTSPADYLPGDLVTWMLPGNLPHIGIVTDRHSELSGNPLVVHNIGAGPDLDDILFAYTITGHYRYVPQTYSPPGQREPLTGR